MSELSAQVRQTIRSARLLRSGERVLIGVSGGADSVALLHLLVRFQDAWRLRVAVVHVDHQLRPESAQDAAFVEELARRLKVPVTIVVRDVREAMRRQGWSLEDGARRLRYEAFQAVATRWAATKLALAHTADDQAETVLMRLLRGAGLTGLSAIPMTRALGDVTVIRPLLNVWKADLLEYLTIQHLSFRQDSTNGDARFLRNRIRTELLPLLEQAYNPRVKALLGQLAEQCRTDTLFLQEAAQRHWKRLVKSRNGQMALRISGFLKQPKALQRQLIRLAVQRLQGDLTGFEFRHWMEIERLFIERPVGTVLDLPGAMQCERRADDVLMRHASTFHSSALQTT